MNKGLKSYTQQLNLSVGSIDTYTNLYSGDANFIFTLPILTTVGKAPISVGLLFNKQKENEIGMFGKGMKLNYEKKLEYLDVTTIRVTNSDGTVDIYTLNEQIWKYENNETGLTINYADDFIISDQTGNKVVYEVDNSNLVFKYPTRIEMKSGDKIILSESPNYLYLHNEHGDYITMTKNTVGMVEEITWTKNNNEMLKAYLTYTNNYLTKVVVKKGEAVLSEYAMEYNSGVIILTDVLTKDISYYSMTNNQVENIYFGKINNDGLFMFIDVDGNKTKVTDELGNIVTYVFDNDGMLRFLKDDRGNIISYQYEMNTKQLIAENPLVPTNNNENLYKDSNIRNEVLSSMNYGSVSEVDEFYTSLVGSNVIMFSGGGKYSFDLSAYLYKNEVITLVAWVKQKGSNSGWITLSAEGSQSCTTYLNKQSMDNEYQPIVVGLKLKENVTSISVYIQANTEIYVGKIEVFKKGFGAFYEYENLKLKKININGNINEISYNEAGEVISTTLASSKVVKLNRNDKGLVVDRATEFGIVNETTYDEKNRALENVVSNRHGDKKFKLSYSYNDDTSCTTTDALENQLLEDNDLYGNTTMLVNALSQVLDYNYYENLALKSIGLRKENNEDDEHTYLQETQIEYHENNLIKKITLKNGTYFTYEYNERNLLTVIKQGDMILMSFLYNEYDNIRTIYRGERLEFTISYDNYNRVVEINITDNLGVITKYNYIYDNLDLLKTIYKNDEVYKTYEYDNNSNLTVVTDSLGNKQTYLYENNLIYGEINNIDNKKMHRMFNSSLEGQDYFSIYSRLFDNGKYSIAPLDTSELKLYINPENTGNSTVMIEGRIEGNQTEDDVIVKDVSMPRLALDSNSVLVYNLNMQNSKGFFGFWINLKEFNNSDINIFEVRNNYGSSVEKFEIFVNSNQKVGVKYYNNSGVITKTVITGRKIYLNEWVYIGFDYLKETNTNISLYINDEVYTMIMPKYTMEQITCKIGGTANCEISGFVCGFNQELSEEEIIKYFKETKHIFADYKQEDIAKNKSVVIYPNTTELNDVYPLISNCYRLDGAIYYNGEVFPENNCSLEDFKYDKELGRNVFNVEGQDFIFRNLDTNEMTISMYVKAKENDANKKVLCEIKQDEDNKIGLFVDIDNRVKIYVGQNIYSTGIVLSINTWTYVGFSYTLGISSGSLAENEFNFNIVVGTNTYTIVCETDIEIESGIIAIGRRYEDENLDIFNGKMANLYIIDSGLTANEMLEKKNYLDSLPVSVSGYDEFGRFIRRNIKKFTNDIIKNEVKYATATNTENNTTYELNIIEKETISLNNQTITRTYTTDSLGRVTGITDSVFGNKNYVYDDRGFLTYDNGVRMLYDANGNIKSYGSNTFGYGLTNDRLLNVNGRIVTYDSLNNFMPLSINGMTLSWEQNKLKQITKNNNTIRYEYNEQGLRTKKFTPSVDKEYYYNKDKLITEICDNYRLDFLYDENDMLFGFIYNNTDKYYYVRDILLNILGIVDNQGTLVVKYDCNAWGKPINGTNNNGIILDTTSNNIGSINPFRYKGYYYDEETQLYWVSSRYYSPELCRWISPDSIEYLDPESINGLNLYAYCGNDPINKYDPSGHFAISALIIGAIIGAVVGFGIAAYIDYQDDGQIFNGSVAWYDYLGATVLGGAIGAGLGAFAGMSFSATLPTGFALAQTSAGTMALVATGSMTVTVTGAQILGAAGILSATYMFTKTIVDEGGVRITHNYPDDHGSPVHVHVSSDSGMTRVGPNGYPLNGDRILSRTENKIFWRNIKKIRKVIKKLQKIIRRLPW